MSEPDCGRCGHPFNKHRTPGSECVQVTGRDAQGFETYCSCASYQGAGAVELGRKLPELGVLVGVDLVVSREIYRDRKIEVLQTDRARPYCVAVDGEVLFGSGMRVRRRLNYSTPEAAAAQGRRHVRQLGGST